MPELGPSAVTLDFDRGLAAIDAVFDLQPPVPLDLDSHALARMASWLRLVLIDDMQSRLPLLAGPRLAAGRLSEIAASLIALAMGARGGLAEAHRRIGQALDGTARGARRPLDPYDGSLLHPQTRAALRRAALSPPVSVPFATAFLVESLQSLAEAWAQYVTSFTVPSAPSDGAPSLSGEPMGLAQARARLSAMTGAVHATATGMPVLLDHTLLTEINTAMRPDDLGMAVGFLRRFPDMLRLRNMRVIPAVLMIGARPGSAAGPWRAITEDLSVVPADAIPLTLTHLATSADGQAWRWLDARSAVDAAFGGGWHDAHQALTGWQIQRGRSVTADESRVLSMLLHDAALKLDHIGALARQGITPEALLDDLRARLQTGELLPGWTSAASLGRSLDVHVPSTPGLDGIVLKYRAWLSVMPGIARRYVDEGWHRPSPTAIPANVDRDDPMPVLRAVRRELKFHFAMPSGPLTLFDSGPDRTVIRFAGAAWNGSHDPGDALHRIRDIRSVEDFIIGHLLAAGDAQPRLPPSMVVTDHEILAHHAVLARREATDARRDGIGTWRADADSVAAVTRVMRQDLLLIPSDPAAWPSHGLPPVAATGGDPPPARLRLIVQRDANRDTTLAAWLLARKHAGSAVWVRQTPWRRYSLLTGQALLDAAPAGVAVTVSVVGQGGRGQHGARRLSGLDEAALGADLDWLLTRLGLVSGTTAPGAAPAAARASIAGISLVACDLATPVIAHSFGEAFTAHLTRYGWGRDPGPVIVRTGKVHVAETEEGRILKLSETIDPVTGRARYSHQSAGRAVTLRWDEQRRTVVSAPRGHPLSGTASPMANFTDDDTTLRFDAVLDPSTTFAPAGAAFAPTGAPFPPTEAPASPRVPLPRTFGMPDLRPSPSPMDFDARVRAIEAVFKQPPNTPVGDMAVIGPALSRWLRQTLLARLRTGMPADWEETRIQRHLHRITDALVNLALDGQGDLRAVHRAVLSAFDDTEWAKAALHTSVLGRPLKSAMHDAMAGVRPALRAEVPTSTVWFIESMTMLTVMLNEHAAALTSDVPHPSVARQLGQQPRGVALNRGRVSAMTGALFSAATGAPVFLDFQRLASLNAAALSSDIPVVLGHLLPQHELLRLRNMSVIPAIEWLTNKAPADPAGWEGVTESLHLASIDDVQTPLTDLALDRSGTVWQWLDAKRTLRLTFGAGAWSDCLDLLAQAQVLQGRSPHPVQARALSMLLDDVRRKLEFLSEWRSRFPDLRTFVSDLRQRHPTGDWFTGFTSVESLRTALRLKLPTLKTRKKFLQEYEASLEKMKAAVDEFASEGWLPSPMPTLAALDEAAPMPVITALRRDLVISPLTQEGTLSIKTTGQAATTIRFLGERWGASARRLTKYLKRRDVHSVEDFLVAHLLGPGDASTRLPPLIDVTDGQIIIHGLTVAVRAPEAVMQDDAGTWHIDPTPLAIIRDQGSAQADDAAPWAGLARRAPHVRQLLDRESGRLTLTDRQRGIGWQVRVRPLIPHRAGVTDPDRGLQAQTQELLALEAFALQHLLGQGDDPMGALPPVLIMGADAIRAHDMVVGVRHTIPAGGSSAADLTVWRPYPPSIASLRRMFGPSGAHGLPPGPEAERPLPLPPEPVPDGKPLAMLKLIVQLEDSPDVARAAALLVTKYPDSAAWVRDRDGEVLRGRALLASAGKGTEVAVYMVGHGGGEPPFTQTLSGKTARLRVDRLEALLAQWRLADPAPTGLDRALAELNRHGGEEGSAFALPAQLPRRKAAGAGPRIGHISLVACDLATPALARNFATEFMEALADRPWAWRTTVSARTGELHLTQIEGAAGEPGAVSKRTLMRAWDGSRWFSHQEHGDTVTMRLDTGTGETITDYAYPAGHGSFKEASTLNLREDVTLGAPRPPAQEISSLMSDFIASLQPDTRALMMRDPQAMALTQHLGGTSPAAPATSPADAADAFDLSAIARLTPEGALDHLNASPLIDVITGNDDVALMHASGALLALSDADFLRFCAEAGSPHAQGARPTVLDRFLQRARQVRAHTARFARGLDPMDTANLGVGAVNTVIGGFQLAHGWRHLDDTMKGLSLTQLSGIVTTPLTAAVGRWMASTSAAGHSALMRRTSRWLQGGVADVALAALGLAATGLQWEQFHASGLGKDSHEYRALVASTAIASVLTAASLAMNGIQIAAALKGGAAAIAGTSLGTAASLTGVVALPFALVSLLAANAVMYGVWVDEYGAHVRVPAGTAAEWRVVGALIGKFFGFDTDVSRRAEVEKMASTAARQRGRDNAGQWREAMGARADHLAKQGYTTFHHPAIDHHVAHATFKRPSRDQPFAFALQDRPRTRGQSVLRRDLGKRSAPGSTAWLEARAFPQPAGVRSKGRTERQWLDLTGAKGFYHGGRNDDVFLLDRDSALGIDGLQGHDDMILDASGAHVLIGADPAFSGNQTWKLLIAPERDALKQAKAQPLRRIESIVVRDALSAHVTGGPGDDRFDVHAAEARIAGGSGRNVYLLRTGNDVVSTSARDVAVWAAGTAARIESGPGASRLLLVTDVLQEALSWRRRGTALEISAGVASLTLTTWFDTSAGEERQLLIQDASGVVMTPDLAAAVDDTGLPSSALPKTIYLDVSAPASRRSLSPDDAMTRHHLAAGAGSFTARPFTSMPMLFMLDVPAARLRYRFERDVLVIEEVSPAGAPAGFAPLTLTLEHYVPDAGRFAIWARDLQGDGTAADSTRTRMLQLPTRDGATSGPLAAMEERAVVTGDIDAPSPPIAMADSDAIADTPVLTAGGTRAWLKMLIAQARPFRYVEAVLRHGLTHGEVEVFERWARRHLSESPGSPASTGSPAWCSALDAFARMLRPTADHAVPDHPQRLSLLGMALQVKGRPRSVAPLIARAMVDAGTLDDRWIVAMLQAGVTAGAQLAALWKAGTTAQDLLIGNLHRTRYEGLDDRRGLVRVETNGELSARLPPSIHRFVSRKFLKLDEDGHSFIRADDVRVPGVHYDLAPGELVFPQGVSAQEALGERQDMAEMAAKEPGSASWHRRQAEHQKFRGRAMHLMLEAKGWVDVVTEPLPSGQRWWGRSSPDNLIDGIVQPGDAFAWRPWLGDSPHHTDTISLEAALGRASPELTFSFAHAVALDTITLHLSKAPVKGLQSDGFAQGEWSVCAMTPDGWMAVAEPVWIRGHGDVKIDVETKGVPYRQYALRGHMGWFPIDAWFTEVSFTTAQAGASAATPTTLASLLSASMASSTGGSTAPLTASARSSTADIGATPPLFAPALQG